MPVDLVTAIIYIGAFQFLPSRAGHKWHMPIERLTRILQSQTPQTRMLPSLKRPACCIGSFPTLFRSINRCMKRSLQYTTLCASFGLELAFVQILTVTHQLMRGRTIPHRRLKQLSRIIHSSELLRIKSQHMQLDSILAVTIRFGIGKRALNRRRIQRQYVGSLLDCIGKLLFIHTIRP